MPRRVLLHRRSLRAKADGGMLALTKTKAELEAEPQEGMLTRDNTLDSRGNHERVGHRYFRGAPRRDFWPHKKPTLCLKRRFELANRISW